MGRLSPGVHPRPAAGRGRHTFDVVRDLQAMTPAERGRALARAVGIRRRLEVRRRNGLALSAADTERLRHAQWMLLALSDLEVALQGSDLTLGQARSRRVRLRKELGLGSRGKATNVVPHDEATSDRRRQKLAELAQIEKALAENVAKTTARRPASRERRAQPSRVVSVVNGGLPGLGRR